MVFFTNIFGKTGAGKPCFGSLRHFSPDSPAAAARGKRRCPETPRRARLETGLYLLRGRRFMAENCRATVAHSSL